MILPVIVAVGGINPAGRSSGFHAYKRMIHQALSEEQMASTWRDLAHRMNLSSSDRAKILAATLVRRIDNFDPNQVLVHEALRLSKSQEFLVEQQESLAIAAGEVIYRQKHKILEVQSAGCLPQGFDPSQLYHSKNHPRGLSMTVYALSDALTSLGMDWTELYNKVKPDQISVYAGSALGQVDDYSLAGLVANPLRGQRVSSKMMPLSLAEMPADFINSYMLNSVGRTGHNMGACATFLYNLRLGVEDIQSGRARIAVIGSAEAPVTPDIIEGFHAMGALATDESLRKLDQSSVVDYTRACRPFSTNTGFVIAESAQFAILVDEQLALESGLSILAAVPGVFVHADGNKKSIAGPGVGNYLTMAKTMHLAQQILGPQDLNKTYVQAHGTGTPQNRVTESHILNEIAQTYGLSAWKVAAIKSYVGHSIGAAAGDQLMSCIGAWELQVLPKIPTIDHIASDVFADNLDILMQHHSFKPDEIKACLINSKGFGGNNASALILSPEQTQKMLKNKYGTAAMKKYYQASAVVTETQQQMDVKKSNGQEEMVYHFGTAVMDMHDVRLSQSKLHLSKFNAAVDYDGDNPYQSYLD